MSEAAQIRYLKAAQEKNYLAAATGWLAGGGRWQERRGEASVKAEAEETPLHANTTLPHLDDTTRHDISLDYRSRSRVPYCFFRALLLAFNNFLAFEATDEKAPCSLIRHCSVNSPHDEIRPHSAQHNYKSSTRLGYGVFDSILEYRWK